jgi:Progressive ankylosis protein (ANKH)
MLWLWLPLAFTFLLMSGSSPIVSAGITRLPGAKQGLASFCDAFRVSIFLHAPLFVVRDIAIRSVRDRRSYVRLLIFVGIVAVVSSLAEFIVALTPLGDWILLGVLKTPADLVAPTKRALLPFSLIPILIALRGVHQGIHIRGETAIWVGIGTALRMCALAAFALVISPHLGLEGGVMGAWAFVLGLIAETIVTMASALRGSAMIADRTADPNDTGLRGLAAFALPLMLANLVGVLYQPLVSRVAGGAGDPETSKASLQILISWVWFFSSSLFAMQALTIAHAANRAHLMRIVRFGAIVAGVFATIFLTTAFIPAVRDTVLITILGVREPDLYAFITEALPYAVVFPILVLARALLRGLIVRSGHTGWVVITTLAGLGALVALDQSGILDGRKNGSVPAVEAWLLASFVESCLAALALARIGLKRVFAEGESDTH